MDEVWKKSTSMCGYEVSNFGNVRHEKRKRNLSPTDNGNGYLIVGKKNSNKKKNYYVHRLVAEVFCENKNGMPEVNHMDCNKHNNKAENLEWCERIENIRHSISNGRVVFTDERYKRLHECRMMAIEANRQPVLVHCAGGTKYCSSKTEAGELLGVSITTISRIIDNGYSRRVGVGIELVNR